MTKKTHRDLAVDAGAKKVARRRSAKVVRKPAGAAGLSARPVPSLIDSRSLERTPVTVEDVLPVLEFVLNRYQGSKLGIEWEDPGLPALRRSGEQAYLTTIEVYAVPSKPPGLPASPAGQMQEADNRTVWVRQTGKYFVEFFPLKEALTRGALS